MTKVTCYLAIILPPPLFIHTAAGLLLFTAVWSYTLGGYKSSLPLFSYLFIYSYGRQLLSTGVVKLLFTNLLANIVYWYQHERRSLVLIVIYFSIKVLLMVKYRQGEKSNGTPLSLVFFSAFYVFIFIAPTLLSFLAVKLVTSIKFILSKLKLCIRNRQSCRKYSSGKDSTIILYFDQAYVPNRSKVFTTLWNWRISVCLILLLTITTYITDGDITSVIRFACVGKPCWPLLIPPNVKTDLPYYLKHSWIKSWHELFDGYQPNRLITQMLFIAREMEVIHTLPLLIGLFILSQLFLPREFVTIKRAFFGCISAVVLAGITSGSLKLLFHRYRPNAYGNPYYWTGPATTYVNHLHFSKLDLSFPCGHTSVTSAIATCLYLALIQSHREYRLSRRMNVWLIVCLYCFPCLVLVSRVSDCYHWASDGMFGVFLGYVIGHIVMTTKSRADGNEVEMAQLPKKPFTSMNSNATANGHNHNIV